MVYGCMIQIDLKIVIDGSECFLSQIFSYINIDRYRYRHPLILTFDDRLFGTRNNIFLVQFNFRIVREFSCSYSCVLNCKREGGFANFAIFPSQLNFIISSPHLVISPLVIVIPHSPT